jgi:glycosyltransferase involved in cell wall biosynthesis
VFHGGLSKEQTRQELLKAHVLVHPSFHDSAGLVCLEALEAGRPVICLNTGGPAELVNASCGIRVSVDSKQACIQELSAAMVRLAGDDALRIKMGQAGQQRIEDCFSWKRRAERMSCIYWQLFCRKGG